MSSLLRSSKFVRLFAGAARNLLTSTRYTIETGQSPLFTTPSISYLKSFASAAASSTNQYSTSLEKSLQQIDQDVRRVGRVSRRELEEVLEEIKHSRNATSSQSLLLIRCCGSLVPEELPAVRTKLVQEIWSTLEKLKVPMDISHYNALLRVYLENEHNFSPAEFLQNLEKKGVEPNRVTYQRLITRYCQDGDIEGATRILEFMREKSLPVNEHVFNALIMGHAQADDMESAAGIIKVMKQAGLEPSADTYTTLLVGHAKKGNIDQIRQILTECDQTELYLLDKDHLDIVFALATNGHAQHVDEVISRIRKSAGFTQDAISYILRLVNHGQEEVAMKIWKIMPRLPRDDNENVATKQGNFLIRQMVKANRPIDSILKISQLIESDGSNNKALSVAAEACLLQGNLEAALKMLKTLQETGSPIRQHYFWPMLCTAGQAKDDEKINQILSTMSKNFGMQPTNETIRDYVIPNLTNKNSDHIVGFLKRSGVSSGSVACALVYDNLVNGEIAEAASVASKYRAYYAPYLLRRPLTQAYLKTGATEDYLNILHHINEGLDRNQAQTEDSDNTQVEPREVIGFFLRGLLQIGKDRPIDLVAILKGLLERGLGITTETAENIQSHLSGEKLTNEISELLIKLTAEELQAVPAAKKRVPASSFVQDEDVLKERIERGEGAGQSVYAAKRNLLLVYAKNQDADKALELFQSMGEEAGPGSYAYIIDTLALSGRVDEALELLKKFRAVHTDASLNPLKIVNLVNALFKLDRVEEGIKILEDLLCKCNFEETPFTLKAAVFQLLNTLAEKGELANIDRVFELIIKSNFIEVSNVILGPMIKARIMKNDIDAAMKKFEECVEKYKMTPWKNELTKKLIEAEDAVSLQRITDASSKVHGEINSLYDLVFAFVECGRIRQARKILETPGLRNRNQRFNMICERYQQEGTVTALEGLLEATKDMNHIDRSEIFQHLLATHIKNDDADKALGIWTQMQEEDVHPSDAFLISLANFLEKKGIDVPFVKPAVSAAKTKPEKLEQKNDGPSSALISFKNAIRSGQWERAKTVRKELTANNVQIPSNDLSLLLEGFCQSNQLTEALDLAVTMLKNNSRIIPRHLKFLVTKLSIAGEVEKLNQIGEFLNQETKKLVSFDNKLCGAYLASGRAVEFMESLLKEAEKATVQDIASLQEKFPRGTIAGIIESHPELLPKVEQIAEIYGKLGSKAPANALWCALFLTPELEARADKVWNKFNLGEEPRLMFQRVIARARQTRDNSLVQRLLQRIKGSKVSEPAIGIVYSCAIDVLVSCGKTDEAVNQLELAIKDISLENINTTCLQRLQQAVVAEGKPFAYTIPAKKSKSSSSSSSDDESEEKSKQK